MSSELINQVIKLTNIERANAGLQPLKPNSQLADAAQDHSEDMAKDDFFSHTGVDGSNVASRVQDSGYQYSTVGENIAAGQKTAAEVVEGWMNSPGHRANILNANYTEIGIGYEYLENDTGSVNYNRYWTQVFGTSLNSNQGTTSEPFVPENSEPTPEENIDNSADINEQPNLEVELEDSDSTPEVEVELEDNDSTPEVEIELEDNDSTPEVEVELENSGQSEITEENSDDSFDLNNSNTFEKYKYSFDQPSDVLIGKSESVTLAGGDDAIAIFDSPGNDVVVLGEIFQSDFSDMGGNSSLGMAMEGYDNYESIDIMEYAADSSLAGVKQDMMQEFADSFL